MRGLDTPIRRSSNRDAGIVIPKDSRLKVMILREAERRVTRLRGAISFMRGIHQAGLVMSYSRTFLRRSASLACLLLGACALQGGEDVGLRTAPGGKSGRPITVDELDQITKSFADRYVLLLSNACDEILHDVPSERQRRDARRLKLSGATAAFDAATGPDPVKQLVDLAVGVGLQKIVWVDEGQGERLFGSDAARRLSEALETADRELWGLCGLAMKPGQIDSLQKAIRDWRRANPGLPWISDVRFDAIAGVNAPIFIDGIAGALTPASGSVTDSIGRARLLGQRVFYYLKRLPRLLDWQMEDAWVNTLSAPEAAAVLRGVTRTLESSSGVLSRIEAILSSAPEGEGRGDPQLGEVHRLLAEGKELAQAAQQAVAAYSALRPDAPTGRTDKPGSPSFDIKEYTAAGAQISQTIRDAAGLLRGVRELMDSEPGLRRVETAVNATARGMGRERRQSIDHAAWRVAQLLLLTTLLALLYTVAFFRLRRRNAGDRGRVIPP
jgi:hypothetical protein